MRTAIVMPSTSGTTLIADSSAGLRVRSLYAVGLSETPSWVEIRLLRRDDEIIIGKTTIQKGEIHNFLGLDQDLFLISGDRLVSYTNADDSVNVFCSYDLSKTATVQLNFSQDISQKTELWIREEKLNNEDFSGLIKSVVYAGDGNVLLVLNPDAEISQGASVRFRLKGRQYENVDVRLLLSEKRKYEFDVRLFGRRGGSYSEDISVQTLDDAYNYLIEYWRLYDEEPWNVDQHFFNPSKPEEVNDFFNPFFPAIKKVKEDAGLSDQSLDVIEQYCNSHISEVREASLNRSLLDAYYLEGFPLEVNLDSTLTSQQSSSRPIFSGTNFLGVNKAVWDCITDKPLYSGTQNKNKTSKFFPYYDPLGNGAQDFDCRSFTESALIFLREQLRQTCPNATVSILEVPGHSIVYVDLGGEGCCEGGFIYEPQTGDTWDTLEDYSKDYPEQITEGTVYPQDFHWDNDKKLWEPTKWQERPTEVRRIANTICGCVNSFSAPEGSVEKLLQSKCSDGSIEDWFVENYSYESDSKNGQSQEYPSVGGMPQIISCEQYKCTENGCVQSEDGDLNFYECEIFCTTRYTCGKEKIFTSELIVKVGEDGSRQLEFEMSEDCPQCKAIISTNLAYKESSEECYEDCCEENGSSSLSSYLPHLGFNCPDCSSVIENGDYPTFNDCMCACLPINDPAADEFCCRANQRNCSDEVEIVPISPTGACCAGSQGNCINGVSESKCESLGGIWIWGVDCDPSEGSNSMTCSCPEGVQWNPDNSSCCPEDFPSFCTITNSCVKCPEGKIIKGGRLGNVAFCHCSCKGDYDENFKTCWDDNQKRFSLVDCSCKCQNTIACLVDDPVRDQDLYDSKDCLCVQPCSYNETCSLTCPKGQVLQYDSTGENPHCCDYLSLLNHRSRRGCSFITIPSAGGDKCYYELSDCDDPAMNGPGVIPSNQEPFEGICCNGICVAPEECSSSSSGLECEQNEDCGVCPEGYTKFEFQNPSLISTPSQFACCPPADQVQSSIISGPSWDGINCIYETEDGETITYPSTPISSDYCCEGFCSNESCE